MSPLDDELRAALHGRATRLAPSPDPLAGVERRARRLRRNRTAAALAGSVLAVAAVAVAVPALTPSSSGPAPGPAVAPTTVVESPQPAPPYALDLAAPWAYRGAEVPQGYVETLRRELATRRGVAESAVTVSPLFGQVYEPSARFELVHLATVEGQPARWGVSRVSEAGPELVAEGEVASDALSLSTLLDGDEVPRLLVVASPEVAGLQHRQTATGPYADMAPLAAGVATIGVDGDPTGAGYRLLDRDGREVQRSAVVDLRLAEPVDEQRPDNVLGWGPRGTVDDALVERAVQGYARAKAVDRGQVGHVVLFTGDNDPGQRYTVLQAWVRGQRAQVFGWVETPGRDPEPVLQPLTDPGKPVVAILLTGIPGRTTDELVVVPAPETGQVLYTPAEGQERPVDTPGLDGVVLVDRERDAQDDRLRLLGGDGDLDRPTFEGPVFGLLCGEKGCG